LTSANAAPWSPVTCCANQQTGRQTLASIRLVNDFHTEPLNFSGCWYFDDLSCRQADNDFFRQLCSEYRIDDMKTVLASELRHMSEFVYNFYQLRTTDAVNRLAMLSLIFGGGAVLTGFFGMNFGREFGRVLFEGAGLTPFVHYSLVLLVTAFVFGSLALGTAVVLRNWCDYFVILSLPKDSAATSLKRNS
jgi:CorA-like Mg2+ transporter protein